MSKKYQIAFSGGNSFGIEYGSVPKEMLERFQQIMDNAVANGDVTYEDCKNDGKTLWELISDEMSKEDEDFDVIQFVGAEGVSEPSVDSVSLCEIDEDGETIEEIIDCDYWDEDDHVVEKDVDAVDESLYGIIWRKWGDDSYFNIIFDGPDEIDPDKLKIIVDNSGMFYGLEYDGAEIDNIDRSYGEEIPSASDDWEIELPTLRYEKK